MKVIDKILSDKRVSSVSDERYMGDGFWVILNNGFVVDDCHCIHEGSPTKCLKRLKEIEQENA